MSYANKIALNHSYAKRGLMLIHDYEACYEFVHD